jgi:PEP-utilizing family enzyme
VTLQGGATSHAIVVARETSVPVLVDVDGLERVKTGDQIEMDAESGLVDVNGGGGDVDRNTPGEAAASGVTRFVVFGGEVKTVQVNPDNSEEPGTLHTDLMEQFPDFDYENFAMGMIYDDGHADLLGLDDEQLAVAEQWLQSQGVDDIRQVGDMSLIAKVAENDPLKCPECGSHTVRLIGKPEGDVKGEVKCLTCGNTFEREVIKNPESSVRDRTAEGFLDSQPITPAPSYYEASIQKLAPGKKHLPYATPKRNRQYEHIKEQCLADGGSEEHCKELAARTVNKQRAEKGETKGSKVAALADVEAGEWYVMKSPNYKVPDVIQILNIEDNRIEAAIQGDDKGMFPIHITPEEIEKNGYTFEPYTQTEAATGHEPVTTGWKIARRNFTPAEQRALIDENLEGTARNVEKMNLEGTHYKMWERVEEKDALSDFFLW